MKKWIYTLLAAGLLLPACDRKSDSVTVTSVSVSD